MPIYKGKGSRSCASSYRPISLCLTIGKALERLVRDQILTNVNSIKPLWQEVNELESVQRRLTKRLIGQAQHTYGERLRNLSLLSFESQRELTVYFMIYKHSYNMISITLEDAGLQLPTNNTRGCSLRLKQKNNGTVLSASHFKFRAPSAWNSLCYDMVRLSNPAKFKIAIKNKLHCNDEAFFNWHCNLLLLINFTKILF